MAVSFTVVFLVPRPVPSAWFWQVLSKYSNEPMNDYLPHKLLKDTDQVWQQTHRFLLKDCLVVSLSGRAQPYSLLRALPVVFLHFRTFCGYTSHTELPVLYFGQ